ncbi:MAG TPA: NUDIX domain-containing protein [Tepidisphaeraceae bacterium]|jgi:8-oxo-dGTP pyrophosphatase MutT (NUDIX family)
MKHERSAGIVVFRDPPGAERLFLLLDYGRHWDYAKGHVEAGEDDRAAAVRELAEETGITQADFVDGFSREITYVFKNRHGGFIRKVVMFFAARTEEETVELSHEHVGYAWLPGEAALKQLSFANAKDVLRAAIEFLGPG